jgi:V8-like Glu-specific endopeptidase
MSAEMIAGLLRPMTQLNGYIYVRAQPDVDAVVDAHKQPPVWNESSVNTMTYEIIGSDGRVKAPEDQWPYRSIINLAYWTSPIPGIVDPPDNVTSLCTATLIGPSTAITAGHCFNVYLNSWIVRPDGTESPPFPVQPVVGCFHNDVPVGYALYQMYGWDPAPWDFAVMEFDNHPTKGDVQPLPESPHNCGSSPRDPNQHPIGQTPGNTLGYYAWGQHTASVIQNSDPCVFGYPGDKDPEPQLWGDCTLQSPAISPFNSRLIWHRVDTVGGESGAALTRLSTDIMATHVGYDQSWNYNVARRIDADYVNFVYSNSAL